MSSIRSLSYGSHVRHPFAACYGHRTEGGRGLAHPSTHPLTSLGCSYPSRHSSHAFLNGGQISRLRLALSQSLLILPLLGTSQLPYMRAMQESYTTKSSIFEQQDFLAADCSSLDFFPLPSTTSATSSCSTVGSCPLLPDPLFFPMCVYAALVACWSYANRSS